MSFLLLFERCFVTDNRRASTKMAEHVKQLQDRLKDASKLRGRLKAQYDLGKTLRQAALWIPVELCVSFVPA